MKTTMKKSRVFVVSALMLTMSYVGQSHANNPSGNTAAVDQLIEKLCSAVTRCDTQLNYGDCVVAMNSKTGSTIWDNFGLKTYENQLTADDVKAGIADGLFSVNEANLEQCQHELIEACDNQGESFPIGSYDNAENLIIPDGACSQVLSVKR